MGSEHPRHFHDIKRRIADALPETLSKKWEERIRKNTVETGSFTPLNDILSFGLDDDYPDEVQLHVHENLTRTPIEANRSMLEGLKILAERLETDPSLSHIKAVTGYSWIVYNSPDILRKLGFKVSGFNHPKKTALAAMDRDSFVNRFSTRVE